MILANFPLFDTEVVYRNLHRRRAPLYYFQRVWGQRNEVGGVKTEHDTNMTIGGMLPDPFAYKARGFFLSLEGERRDLDVIQEELSRATISVWTGWLRKEPQVPFDRVPVLPMDSVVAEHETCLWSWRLAAPEAKLFPFIGGLVNAKHITASLNLPYIETDPGLEYPLRIRLCVVGDLECPDGIWSK